MDRRGFLRTTFVAGLAAGTGCAADMAERAAKAPLDDDELERRIDRLQRTLARMDGRFAQDWFLEQRLADLDDPSASERLQADGELLRTSLRIATAVSLLADLPEANQRDPRVASEVGKLVGEADYAVFGTLARLDALDPASLAELDREAGEDPRFVERVSEQVDELARKLGVEAGQRLHLRSMTKHLGWRLERERFSSVVADTRTKVDEVLAGAHRRLVEAQATNLVDPNLVDPKWIERTRAAVEYEANANAIAEARADLDDAKRKRNIYLGTGAAMIVVGGALAVGGYLLIPGDLGATLTIGGVGVTAGVVMLVLGIVMAVRVKQRKKDLDALESAGG
ncbi:hypothetical protein ACNOYE_36660 [Nannocystaceae bacterium ST9]